MPTLAPLITADYLLAQALAGARVLTAGAQAALASKAAEASAAVRRYCGDRDFTRGTYTQVLTPALDGTVLLAQFPVNRVTRASGSRAAGLTIANTDRAGHTRATVGFSSTGDEATGIAGTGLALGRVTGGLALESALAFAVYPTLGALAAAVNALGFGWTATVGVNLAAWPSADLCGGDTARNAFSGAELQVFADDLDDCRLDRATGLLAVGSRGGSARFDGPRWGPYQDPVSDDLRGGGAVLVSYDAGFDLVPAPVQQATAIVGLALLDKLRIDSSLASASLGNTSFAWRDAELIAAIPRSARDLLSPYRIVRV